MILRADSEAPSRLFLRNALDFCKACVIRHKNPPTDDTVGGFAARRRGLVRVTGVEPARLPTGT